MSAGIATWAVVVAVPVWAGGASFQPSLALLAMPLLPLWLGGFPAPTGTSTTPRPRSWRAPTVWWLVIFPASLALAAWFGKGVAAGETLTLPTVVLGAVALLVFGGLALSASTRIEPAASVKSETLGAVSGDPAGARRRLARRALLFTAAIGAFAIGVVAPYADRPAWVKHWGDAAGAASVFAAVAAGAIAVVVMTGFAGPATRRSRKRVTRRRSRIRVALSLTVAVTGCGVWLLMTR